MDLKDLWNLFPWYCVSRWFFGTLQYLIFYRNISLTLRKDVLLTKIFYRKTIFIICIGHDDFIHWMLWSCKIANAFTHLELNMQLSTCIYKSVVQWHIHIICIIILYISFNYLHLTLFLCPLWTTLWRIMSVSVNKLMKTCGASQ